MDLQLNQANDLIYYPLTFDYIINESNIEYLESVVLKNTYIKIQDEIQLKTDVERH